MCSPRSRAIHVTLRALAAFLAVALAWESVSAQLPSTSGSKQPPVTIERVVFGFDALIPSETWAPLTVWLTPAAGGDRSVTFSVRTQCYNSGGVPAYWYLEQVVAEIQP